MTEPSGRTFSFLVNPVSGGGAAPAAVVPVARILRDAGATVDVTYSSGPRATLDVIEGAVARGEIVVSVGGDGMLSSIAGRVSQLGGTLGIVPAGRGNDFARMLGLSSDPEEVAAILLEGAPRAIDLLSVRIGDAEPRVVASSVYTGVDAVAGEIVDKVRWLPGKLQYPYAAVHALATYKPIEAHVVIDGVAHDFGAATVVVANSKFYGSGMKIAPQAEVDDGLLDVVVIEAAGRRGLIQSLPKVYDGAHVELDEVHVVRGRSVTINGTPSVPMGGDGEPLGQLPAGVDEATRIDVLPGALQLLLPS
ncbi:YegS/Rv2252/BmrU family lipid kinase [Nocardioides albertanoniae]|uniref:YegS/Rv2252/BmrU family lipid kinase n=1 Tax=Nocardioides albertanoniae TaxID=1175486 RepID=A0A543A4A7_9ACTN|nr:diacylglycerol kinase family protein [Nocardioides albertanoniae]TQL67384.1 YegS/Rv2252/BmrU family lipid kinase [Nocardioides albertanoniae]